jgi:hypothetical protein
MEQAEQGTMDYEKKVGGRARLAPDGVIACCLQLI